MYVITDHNNDANFVILGPITWRPRYISDVLYDELDEEVVVTQADESRVPFEPHPGVKIRKCVSVYEDLTNPKIHYHQGPIWTYDDENEEAQATATWVVQDKPIDLVKGELKSIVSAERWNKENAGITLTIQGNDVWCDTSRGNRDIFLQKFVMMADDEVTRWKFPSVWLDLTKTDLGYIVSEGGKYIQECFDWESTLSGQIDAAETLAELDAIVIVEENTTDNV